MKRNKTKTQITGEQECGSLFSPHLLAHCLVFPPPPTHYQAAHLYLPLCLKVCLLRSSCLFFSYVRTPMVHLWVLPWAFPRSLLQRPVTYDGGPGVSRRLDPVFCGSDCFMVSVWKERRYTPELESKFGTGSRSQGPRPNNGLPWSSRKTFITSPHSPLTEKANCELRKLMTLKLSIYLGLSPPYEMPQKVPVSLFLSEEAWI